MLHPNNPALDLGVYMKGHTDKEINSMRSRDLRWKSLSQKRQVEPLAIKSVAEEQALKRDYSFRSLSKEQRKDEIAHHKASLHSATSITVETALNAQQQVMQTRTIAAFQQQQRQRGHEENLRGFDCITAFQELQNIDVANIDASITKECSWVYWQCLWHTWLGNPHKILIKAVASATGKDESYYLNDPKLGDILKKIPLEQATDENVLFAPLIENERFNPKISYINKSQLVYLVKNAPYFQDGLDFKHPMPGVSLDYDSFFSEWHLKYSPNLAQAQTVSQHAQPLLLPKLPFQPLSADLRDAINLDHIKIDDLGLSVANKNYCVGVLNELQFNNDHMKALLPVYDEYGEEGLVQLLKDLHDIATRDSKLFTQIKKYSIDGHENLIPLLAPEFQKIIKGLNGLDANARAMWSILLSAHMDAVGVDDLTLLATSFLDFSQKVTSWSLNWPDNLGNLAQSKNLHITLGRAISILGTCLAADRQAQFDCLPQLDLGPFGAIMAISQQMDGYHFISEKALINNPNYSSLFLGSSTANQLNENIDKQSGKSSLHCSLRQSDLSHALFHEEDKTAFEQHFFRFIGGNYYRPSIDFFKKALEEIDTLAGLKPGDIRETKGIGNKNISYDPTHPWLMSILASATCGIQKARFATLEQWRELLKYFSENDNPKWAISSVLKWYRPSAPQAMINGVTVTCLPYSFEDSPSLPELIQLVELSERLMKSGYHDQSSEAAARDAYYLSFKNYDEINKTLFDAQIELIAHIIKNPLISEETSQSLNSPQNERNGRTTQKQNTIHIDHIKKGLIKILSTFNISQKELPAVYQSINQLIAAKGFENTRDVLNYLSKISTYGSKNKLDSTQLNLFITDYLIQSSVADTLMRHFPKSFAKQHFIHMSTGSGTIDKNLLNKLNSFSFSTEIKKTLLSFLTERAKHDHNEATVFDLEEFLYLLSELKKTVNDDSIFEANLPELLHADDLKNTSFRKINSLMTLIASEGVQFCFYMLQECKERKIPFEIEHVRALHRELNPYVQGGSDHPIPPVTALTLISEIMFSKNIDVASTSQILNAFEPFFKKENEQHLLSQEYFIKILSETIKSNTLSSNQIIEFLKNMNSLFLVSKLDSEVTYALCYQFQNNVTKLNMILSAVTTVNENDQVLLLKLLDKWLRQAGADLEEVSNSFVAFVNINKEVLSQHRSNLQDIYAHAPYPDLTQLQSWLQRKLPLLDEYAKFTQVPNVYNTFNQKFALGQANQIRLLAGEPASSSWEENLNRFKVFLDAQKGKNTTRLRSDFNRLKGELQNKEKKFEVQMELLAVVAALLYMSTQPEPLSLNETQLLALLFWLKEDKSIGLQIETGEGKSRICMVASALMAASGMAVDFVTSNAQLAARDFTDYHAFFESMNISTRLIDAKSPVERCQKEGINFTDARSLRLVRGKALLEGTLPKIDGSKRALMLDEADDLLFDQTFDSCQISRSLEQFRNQDVSWICSSAIKHIRLIRDELKNDEVFTAQDINDHRDLEIKLFQHYIQTKTPYAAHLLALEKSTDPKQFKEQMSAWLKAAISALDFKENEDFEIKLGRLRQTERGSFLKASDAFIIVKGRVDKDSRWGHWVHSCLEARLNLEREEKIKRGEYVSYDAFEVGSEKRVLVSTTPHNLLEYYRPGKIFGVSGTLGAKQECIEAHKSYDLSLFTIPRQQRNHRIDLPIKVAANQEEHYRALREYIENAHNDGRPVVVFCKDKAEALRFSQSCIKNFSTDLLGTQDKAGNYNNFQLITSEISGTSVEAERIKRAGDSGMITISTEMIGRGTDIKIGGGQKKRLEILCTHLPSTREYRQMIGRAGRNGQQGFSRLVLNRQDLPCDIHQNSSFFFARRTYLLAQQEQLSIAIQQERLLDNCRSQFIEQMAQCFFSQIHEIQDIDAECVSTLTEEWGKLLEQCDLIWSSHQQQTLQAKTTEDMQEKLTACFNEMQGEWNNFIEKCRVRKVNLTTESVNFAPLVTHLEKPELQKEIQKLRTDIYQNYDSANDGTAVVYNSLFQDTRALLEGKRKFFANTRAWWHDPNSATLFADTRATLSGARSLFANTRATLKHKSKLHDEPDCNINPINGIEQHAKNKPQINANKSNNLHQQPEIITGVLAATGLLLGVGIGVALCSTGVFAPFGVGVLGVVAFAATTGGGMALISGALGFGATQLIAESGDINDDRVDESYAFIGNGLSAGRKTPSKETNLSQIEPDRELEQNLSPSPTSINKNNDQNNEDDHSPLFKPTR